MINRIAWLDALKGFAIFTVVLGHCVTDCLASNTFPKDKEMLQRVYDFIYSFHMPLFFLISGYLFYLTKSYRKYEIKVIDFMIIYLLWNVLTWFLKFFMADAVNNPVTLQNLMTIFYIPLQQYWYLYSLIIFYLIFSIFNIRKINIKVLIFMLFIAVFSKYYNLEISIVKNTLFHMFFFALGGYLNNINLGIKNNLIYNSSFVIICILNCILYICNIHVFKNPFMAVVNQLVVASSASLLLVFIFNKYKRLKTSKMFMLFGQYSLQIYLVHCFITAGTRFGLRYLNIVNLPLYFILGTLLGLLIPIGLAKWCNGKGLLNFPFAPIKEIKKIGVIKI